MSTDIIAKRLESFNPETLEDEQNALKEILQEVILYSLSTTDFFEKALFHGGTSLRILNDLPRFSEDLDFILNTPDNKFSWEPYLDTIVIACKQFGIEPTVQDRSKSDKTVQKMFLKDNSIGKLLNLQFHHHPGKKLMIKLEIDTNPPARAAPALQFLEFPLDHSIASMDLSTNFAGKCHALLCRTYIKGRDWYDFSWFVREKIKPNLNFLNSAINQTGDWSGQNAQVTSKWLAEKLKDKIKMIDWNAAAREVSVFLRPQEKMVTDIWGQDFFLDKVEKFETYLLK